MRWVGGGPLGSGHRGSHTGSWEGGGDAMRGNRPLSLPACLPGASPSARQDMACMPGMADGHGGGRAGKCLLDYYVCAQALPGVAHRPERVPMGRWPWAVWACVHACHISLCVAHGSRHRRRHRLPPAPVQADAYSHTRHHAHTHARKHKRHPEPHSCCHGCAHHHHLAGLMDGAGGHRHHPPPAHQRIAHHQRKRLPRRAPRPQCG